MSEKYYVVSESELNALSAWRTGGALWSELEKAEAACRARPVEKVKVLNMWAEINEEDV